jgi:hypothetical protein
VDLRAPVPSHWLLVGFDVAAPSRSATGRASALATAVKQSLGVVVRFDEAAPSGGAAGCASAPASVAAMVAGQEV